MEYRMGYGALGGKNWHYEGWNGLLWKGKGEEEKRGGWKIGRGKSDGGKEERRDGIL